MRKLIAVMTVLNVCLLGAVPGYAQGAPAKITETAKGKVLADTKGMTLYVFDKDTVGKSNCDGPCIRNWPALAAAANSKPSGDWTVVTRDDGTSQWAYKGKPLYTWSKDTQAGDTTGDGVNKVWHVATP
jgi:predicted lipoprotein with Yx(FWY)xxD motif